MKEIVIHVGMHKTGTTSVQASLKGYDRDGVRFAELWDENHSIPVYTMFSANRDSYHVHTRLGLDTESIGSMRTEMFAEFERELALDRSRLILSGEDISLLGRDDVESMGDFLRSRAERIRIVAYVRDPLGFASSAFQQYVQGGKRQYGLPHAEYRNRFEKFLDVFGREAVEFVKFDRNELDGGTVVADFCRRVDIPVDRVRETQANESVSATAIQLLYLFNREGVTSIGNDLLLRSRREFRRRLNAMFTGPGLKLPAAAVLGDLDVDDVRWMEEVSGFELLPAEARSESVEKVDVERMLGDIEPAAVEALREEVGRIDAQCTEDMNVVGLLDFLFFSIYFQAHYAEAASRTAPEPRSRWARRVSRRIGSRLS